MFRKRDDEQKALQMIAEGQPVEEVLALFPEQAEALRPALEAAHWLRQQEGAFEPRPGFVAASQHRLVTRLQAEEAASRQQPAWRRALQNLWRPAGRSRLVFRLALLALLAAVLLGGSRTLALAAPAWLPGDVFYPLKTRGESLSLLFAPSPASKAALHTEFARRRLIEVQALVFEGRYAQIRPTSANFGMHVEQAVSTIGTVARQDQPQAQALAGQLQQVLEDQNMILSLLAGMTPKSARVDFQRVLVIAVNGLNAMHEVLAPGSGSVGLLAALPGRPALQFCWESRRKVTYNLL